MQVNYTATGIDFFRAYTRYMELDSVIRAGFALWGVYGKTDYTSIEEDRKQSDLEHCAGMSFLATMLPIYYPGIYPLEEVWKYQLVTILHELGEIDTGDIPDDGRRDPVEKDLREREYVFRYINIHFPKEYQEIGKKLFVEMQDKSTAFGKTAYLIDKIDAVLRGFAYELHAKYGKISKKPYKTERDSSECAFTGVENLADNWLCGLFDRINHKDYPNLGIFLEICQSAAFYIRGKPMAWLQKI